MAIFEHDDIRLHYEVYGEGEPLLLLAPGGMHSAISVWEQQEIHPIKLLSDSFQVIAMDQRNAGQSYAPVSGDHGWHTYADDQLRLLDHLGIGRCHLAGMCIGCSYSLGLIQAQPERIIDAVLFQPIGHNGANRSKFIAMFNSWRDDIMDAHSEAATADWEAFCNNMYGQDKNFVFNVSEQMVSECKHPLMVLCGRDDYHPETISRRLARLATNVQFVEHWRGEHSADASQQILQFLQQHKASA